MALPQLVAAWWVWKRDPRAGVFGMVVGVALVLWIAAQTLLLQRYFFLQPVVVAAGLLFGDGLVGLVDPPQPSRRSWVRLVVDVDRWHALVAPQRPVGRGREDMTMSETVPSEASGNSLVAAAQRTGGTAVVLWWVPVGAGGHLVRHTSRWWGRA